MSARMISPSMAHLGFEPATARKGWKRTDMLRPKPTPQSRRPFIPAIPDCDLSYLIGSLKPADRQALMHIVETADLIPVEGCEPYLLVPTTPQLLETLATFEAEAEDLEPEPEEDGDPAEDDDPAEDGGDDEPNGDDEAKDQLAAKALSLTMLSVTMGYHAPGARADWEPGGSKPGRHLQRPREIPAPAPSRTCLAINLTTGERRRWMPVK